MKFYDLLPEEFSFARKAVNIILRMYKSEDLCIKGNDYKEFYLICCQQIDARSDQVYPSSWKVELKKAALIFCHKMSCDTAYENLPRDIMAEVTKRGIFKR